MGDKVFLFTEEVLASRSINTQKADLKKQKFKKKITGRLSLASHGFATTRQKIANVTLGSLFWLTIVIIGKTHQ